jgi:hypothetical protein
MINNNNDNNKIIETETHQNVTDMPLTTIFKLLLQYNYSTLHVQVCLD